MTGFFHGTATAMVTPFADGNVNFEAFGHMIEYQIAGGTDVLLVLGTTGEPATMTDAEKEAVMRFAVQKVAGRAKIVFGSGSNSTAKAIEASKKAEALGADGLIVVTPYYNKCTQNGIYEHYKAICEAVSVPVVAYNVPARTGVNILPATAERLAGIPNLAGIKEACGNMGDEGALSAREGGKTRRSERPAGQNAARHRRMLLRSQPHPRQIRLRSARSRRRHPEASAHRT